MGSGTGTSTSGSAGESGRPVSSKEESDDTDVFLCFVGASALAGTVLLTRVVGAGAGTSASAGAFFLVFRAGSVSVSGERQKKDR